ncbi:Pentatricopeptide repeat-containing protein At5g46580, chloroplastic [Linum grandiflorum]
MAATLSAAAAMDVHFTTHQSDANRTFFFSSASSSSSHSRLPFPFTPNSRFLRRRRPISITASATESPNDSKNQSLSEQLKPLSSATLSAAPDHREAQLTTTRPKSVWVNPAKPRRSVVSLHRHKRSPYQHNPKVEELRLFARKLSDCEVSEAGFASAIEKLPHPPTRDNSLLILNSMKSWEQSYMFFDWIKKQELFPLETIFYNVVFKSLRFGKQFGVMEDLANEMVSNGIALDNITYSTIISCAKRCNRYDKALEWFERMYKTGLMPDEVTYSAVLDVYAKLGKVEEVLSLYERGVASGWKPDPIAFSVMAKMFGEAGDYDGIRYVLQEMKNLGVQPNMVVYNNLLEAMGKAGKPGLARSLFEEMLDSGLTPNEKTLTALIKIYGKARWAKDAMELWERMRSQKWPMDFILYNTLLNMCADLALVDDAEKLFEDMKKSENCRPDSWTYTAMLNIYGSGGNAAKAMELFEVMSGSGVKLNVMGCTCLIQCLGKARKVDELVKVFDASIAQGIKPDDRLCGCLLSVMALCETNEDAVKVVGCLQKCNRPKLVRLMKMIEDETTSFEVVKEEFKTVMSSTETESRRPFCNCLIDICRSKELETRAHELLYLGTLFGLYPDLHNVTREEWSLDVRSLSIGAAYTALEEWMGTLEKFVEKKEELPEVFAAQAGAGTHKFAQGMANSFAAHVEKLGAPFRQCEERAGCFVANRDDLVAWLESRITRSSSATATAA